MKSCTGYFSGCALFLMLCISCECQTKQELDVLLQHIQQLKQFLRKNSQAEHNSTRYNLTLKIQIVAEFWTPVGIRRETTEIAVNGAKTNPSGQLENISYALHESCDVVHSMKIGLGQSQPFLPPEETTKNTTQARPRHCEDVQTNLVRNGSQRKNGVYRIYPFNDGKTNEFHNGVDVFCDLETDGGNWTVIQRRRDSTNFNRTWREYSQGFGNVSGSYWLGLLAINELTKNRDFALRLDLDDYKGNSFNVTYGEFWVDGPEKKFRLYAHDHSVNLGRAVNHSSNDDTWIKNDNLGWYNNGHMFSTFDQNNTISWNRNCGQYFGAGWWFSNCGTHSNLNGWYMASENDAKNVGNSIWWGVRIKRAEMKIRNTTVVQ